MGERSHEVRPSTHTRGMRAMARPVAQLRVQPGKAMVVQRFSDRARRGPVGDPAALVSSTLATPSHPLDAKTRQFAESRLGFDFSRVRVHADLVSAGTAQALNAQAFTVGDHIVFAAGKYAPASRPGMRLLAHELAHVVQQNTGAVSARPGALVSDPTDHHERAAEATADRVMSAPALTRPRSPLRTLGGRLGPPVAQRFLAGEGGHQGIEEPALGEAGFSEKEQHQGYFGNWLRDFSQKLNTESDDSGPWPEIIKVLATGEFGRAPTDEELGRYLPSEHVDRPDAGESAESPDIDDKTRAKRREKLSSSQKAWFDEEQSDGFKKQNALNAGLSGLPDYIERAKEHAKRMIGQAAALGRNEKGLMALGNGLHAVEDYFAHSNFVEVALAQLVDDRVVAKDNPAAAALHRYPGVDPTKVAAGPAGFPGIVTGTSAKGPNDDVGMGEVIKTEFSNGEFRRLFLRGATIRWGWQAPKEGGRRAGGWIGEKIGAGFGAIGGAIKGLFTGAGHGAAEAWRGARHWWQKPFAAIGGLVSGGLSGAAEGGSRGLVAGKEIGGRVGSTVGAFIGRAASLAVAPTVAVAMFGIITALSTLGGVPLSLLAKHKITKGTRESITQKDAKGVPVPGPTHSQIAKDDPDQPLHRAAARLAFVADRGIGQAMIRVWAGDETVEAAQRLIDLYMAHPLFHQPHGQQWWRQELADIVKPKAKSR